MINIILQCIIFGLTGSGLWLTGSDDLKQQRRGFLLCLLGQPFWLWDTFHHQQWGMLLLCIWLSISFTRGWLQRRV